MSHTAPIVPRAADEEALGDGRAHDRDRQVHALLHGVTDFTSTRRARQQIKVKRKATEVSPDWYVHNDLSDTPVPMVSRRRIGLDEPATLFWSSG